MLSKLWKGLWEDKPRCEAEMKLGVQVFRDVHCVLPKGHGGRHQANLLTSWPRKEKQGLQGPQRDDL